MELLENWYTNNENINYINLRNYINNVFENEPIVLKVANMNIDNLKGNEFNSFIVHSEDKVIEGNLRMVDSYFPEILFALAFRKSGKYIISDLMESSRFQNDYLKYKLQHFFEVLLFSDFCNKVFTGKLNYYTCYVYKGEELIYYRVHDCYHLFSLLINKCLLDVNFSKAKTETYLTLKFFMN